MKQLFPLFLLFPLLLSAQSNRLYVKTDAAGSNDGSSWANAFQQLTTALQAAEPGDTVWVAEGTYLPDDNRDSSFHPRSGVRLYGGFAGTESSLDQRDWVNHPCILSGDVGIPNDSTDNTYTIMYLDQPDSLTVVDGFIFRYGMATYTGSDGPSNQPRRSGGALYIMGADGEAYAVIRHCRFERNHAQKLGGAVYINGSGTGSVAPQFLDCVFLENGAGEDGGAVYRDGSSWVERIPDFGNCLFQNNRAGHVGGGLYFQDAERSDTLQLNHCDFLGNHATENGGGIRVYFVRSTGGLLTLRGGTHAYNTARVAAAISIVSFSTSKIILLDHLNIHHNGYLTEIATREIIEVNVFGYNGARFTLSNLEFNHNRAIIGIIASIPLSNITRLSNSNFHDNNVSNLIELNGSSMLMENTTFKEKNVGRTIIVISESNNMTVRNCLFQNEIPQDSSGLYSHTFSFIGTNARIFNCTFSDKKLFLIPGDQFEEPVNIKIENSILFGTQGFLTDYLLNGLVTVSLANSCLYNTTFNCADLPSGTCGPNIITDDPQFVQPDSGDYHLQPCSPLIGMGSNAFASNIADLDGNPRIIGGQVDMGAYEHTGFQFSALPVITPACTNGNSGAVAFQSENSCPPYTYIWSSASGQLGFSSDNLAPGDYAFTISDTRGATITANVTIPAANVMQLTTVSTPVVCGTALGGTASITVLNATHPYLYTWAGGSADSVRTDLAVGSYPITVTDAQGCTAASTVEVSRTGSLTLDIQVQPISCHGAADGSFVVTPTNGQLPFIWQWQNGPSSPAYGPLGPGAYRGTLTDGYNCETSWILPLTDPQAIAFDTVVTQASGFSVADGSAMVTNITGGHPPFAVLWSNGTTGYLAHDLLPGTYTVTVMDANECQQVDTVVISYTSALQAAMEHPLRLFPNPANAVLWLELPDEAGLYRIILTNALGQVVWQRQSNRGRTSLPLNDQSAGMYRVQVITAQRAHYQAKVVVQH